MVSSRRAECSSTWSTARVWRERWSLGLRWSCKTSTQAHRGPNETSVLAGKDRFKNSAPAGSPRRGLSVRRF